MLIGKQSIGYTKEASPNDVCGPGAAQRKIVFAHEATAGQISINLNALVTPTSLSANGFTNASPSDIASATIFANKKNVRLISSIRGELIQFDSFIVVNNMTIAFCGALLDGGGAIDGEIFYAECSAPSSVVTAEARKYSTSAVLTVGQTIVNLGYTYKVNANENSQVGEPEIYVDGVRFVRNVGNAAAAVDADGNYQEIDSGNGYGNSIILNIPRASAGILVADFGIYSASADAEMYSALERVSGILNSVTQDVALLSGEPQSKYMTASVSEVDRATYATRVIDHEARIAELKTVTEIQGTAGATASSAADTYVDVNSSSITIPADGNKWDLVYEGTVALSNNTAVATQVYGNLGIFNSSNVLQDNALALIGMSFPAAISATVFHVRLTARVTAGTYKLRTRCSLAVATANTYVAGTGTGTFTGSLTDPDLAARWYARKVGT